MTVAAVKDEFDGLLRTDPDETEVFLLHFAGHGLASGGRTFWLTTNWKTDLRVIAVEPLKFRLEQFGIRNLTIISDACLSYPDTEELNRLSHDAVLGEGITGQADVSLDRFNAAKEGKAGFMVRAPDPDDARCILSGVLVDALWGHEDKAFDEFLPGKITSGSLCEFLPGRTEAIGKKYTIDSKAEVFQGLPRTHVVYRDGSVPPKPPQRRDWPATISPADRPALSTSLEVFPTFLPFPRDQGTGAGVVTADASGFPEDGRTDRLKADLAAAGRRAEPANLILTGGAVRRIWSQGPVHPRGEMAWQIDLQAGAAQLIVEYHDGRFVPVVVYRGLRTSLSRAQDGQVGWTCEMDFVPLGANEWEQNERKRIESAIALIAKTACGSIDSKDLPAIAAQIRAGKHRNPVLGAIAAYLYDHAGDRDNIRRMAWFYSERGQPVPYDVAFMGVMPSWLGADRQLHVSIPAVAKRPQPGLPDYATCQTQPVEDWPVAGRCPWLRQGWDFADQPEDPEKPMVQGLEGLTPHLGPAAFTTLEEAGAHRLIDLWQLRDHNA